MNPVATYRQRLGRRFANEPYYQIVEANADQLILESRPRANLAPALPALIGGGIFVVGALGTLIAAYWAGGQTPGGNFGSVALIATCMGLLGAFGFVTLFGGIAVATTRNRIVIDRAAGSVIYSQRNRVSSPRSQTLPLTEVKTVAQRTLNLQKPSGAPRPMAIIELQLINGDPWLVDSAVEPTQLTPTLAALQRLVPPA